MALTIDRRQFLTGVVGGGLAAGAVRFSGLSSLLSMAEASAATVPTNGPFVYCTLYGGNDGLNTVVPYDSAIYRSWRGDLAIHGDQALPLGHDGEHHLGFHPSLKGMYQLWKEGKVAIVQGVEYPRPNFSHFTSQSIWQTAQLSGDPASGWLGRWLDATGKDSMRALSIGPTLPPALIGDKYRGGAIVDSTDPGSQLPGQGNTFTGAYRQMMSSFPGEPALQAGQANCGANFLTIGEKAAAALSKEHAPAGTGDAGDIGNQFAIVAELIEYGMPTSVYSVSQSSYDTHSDQAGTHADLLGALDGAVSGFMGAFPTATPGKSPVVMIYSEFGRTSRANASGGTDHSSASVVLVVGPSVKGGFYGQMPSFTKLDPWDNLIYTTDFRRVYATVLERSLGMESSAYVLGGSWRPLGFL